MDDEAAALSERGERELLMTVKVEVSETGGGGVNWYLLHAGEGGAVVLNAKPHLPVKQTRGFV